ncbi:MAG: DNA starvation/stationary phase protection protein [Erysipelotrichales bacterium]|nr:DNA starvation/stationary phase protection protein [Erysipelotrichales bacterium]
MKLHDKMNEYLANQMTMYIKLHNLHWYIKGNGFFTLHAKLEELYNATAETIDEVAERMLMIGASPVGSLQGALKLTKVKELESIPVNSEKTVEILEKDTEWWIKSTKEIIKLAEAENDIGTVDMFSDLLAQYEKLSWMLKSYLAK